MSLRDWAVDVEKAVNNMEDMSKESELKKKRCIYRVPDYIRELDNKACKPQVVSFGPYHHGEKNLEPMERHKNRALLQFLRRSKKPLHQYLDALAQEVKDLKDAYDQPDWLQDNDEKFLQMMILDGCFILEILRPGFQNDYAHDDPIFSDHGILYEMPLIRRDMLLLENQVPLRLLEIILAVEHGEDMKGADKHVVIKLIFRYFVLDRQSQPPYNGLHILDVFRQGLVFEPPPMHRRGRGIRLAPFDEIPSATELYEAGIQFQTSRCKSLKDISYEGITFTLPLLVVNNDTKSQILNLMAFERLHVGAGNEVTSYIFLMGCLIHSGRDACLLRSHNIVHSALGSDEDVANFFGSVCKDFVPDPQNMLDEVSFIFSVLRSRFMKTLTAWRIDLLENYLKSPWGVLSVIAAIILFTLTAIQTVYSVLSYIHRKDK